MELLTGKCKEDFLLKVYLEEDTECVMNENEITNEAFKWISIQDKRFINTLIIEWFDNMEYTGKRLFSSFFTHTLKHRLPHWGFKEVSEKAIQQCNEFYNSLELNQLP